VATRVLLCAPLRYLLRTAPSTIPASAPPNTVACHSQSDSPSLPRALLLFMPYALYPPRHRLVGCCLGGGWRTGRGQDSRVATRWASALPEHQNRDAFRGPGWRAASSRLYWMSRPRTSSITTPSTPQRAAICRFSPYAFISATLTGAAPDARAPLQLPFATSCSASVSPASHGEIRHACTQARCLAWHSSMPPRHGSPCNAPPALPPHPHGLGLSSSGMALDAGA